MKYQLRIPDLAAHDHTTCGGPPHCKINETRAAFEAAFPLWQQTTSEVEAARAFRKRFPDAIPLPDTLKIAGEPTVVMYFVINKEEMKRHHMLKKPQNPCALMELVPETREDRKAVKKRMVFDKHLWFEGWVPEMKEVLFQRKLDVRSSLTIGPQKLDVHFGPAGDNWLMQIPGAISFELTNEFVEQIVGEYVRKHGNVLGLKAEVVNGP